MKRIVAVAVLGAVLAGCSGQAPVGEASAGSPLDQYLGSTVDGPGIDPAKEKQVEELIAACMKEAGFEYVPVDREAFGQLQISFDAQPDRDWVEKYGYGVSTMDDTVQVQEDDPNTAIIEAMSESEQEAYFAALHGSGGFSIGSGSGIVVEGGPDVVHGGPDASGTGSDDPGCYGAATTEVYGDGQDTDLSEFTELFDALGRMYERVDRDPRVAPLVSAWSGCLADAGHPGMQSMEDPRMSIMKEFADINGWDMDFGEGESGGSWSAVSVSGDGSQADPEKLAALREKEVSLAVADLDCRKDYDAVAGEVRLELERQFVIDNQAELERFRDAMNGGR